MKFQLPVSTINIIQASKSEGTWRQYESVLQQWSSFCRDKDWSMWDVDLNHVLCFLTSLYENKLSYSTINTARSALSSVLGKIDGCNLGEHKLVVDFMRGVGRLRPPAPRYSVTWNPDKVLSYLSNYDTNICDLKKLTFKLVALFALCTGQRVQTLSCIQLGNILWENPVQIVITHRLKTTSVVKSNPILILPVFHDIQLCPVRCLKKYVELTTSLRGQTQNLFICFCKPHKAVGSQTISKWLVKVLELSGVDVNKFHAHSFRHAATSKAASNGLKIDTIIKRVGWTPSSKTFANFYNRPIDKSEEFSKSVLNSS